MKFLLLLSVLLVGPSEILGNPVSSSTQPTSTSLTEVTTTPLPWLRFLKDKKVGTKGGSDNPMEPSKVTTAGMEKPSCKVPETLSPSKLRSSGPEPPPTTMDDLINRLAAYFKIPLPPTGKTVDVLAEDRKLNPDTLYDEIYLDWMRKRQAESSTIMTPSIPDDNLATQPPQPQPSTGYMYSPVALPYNPYFPLASFKIQKAMAQAQVDAALASMSITTTPKPLKLKLKINVPAGTDFAQLSQITAGLNLPPGSTYELV